MATTSFGTGVDPDRLIERTATTTRKAPPVIVFVTGVPTDTAPADGSIAIRTDGGVGTTIYQKRSGSWVATAI